MHSNLTWRVPLDPHPLALELAAPWSVEAAYAALTREPLLGHVL